MCIGFRIKNKVYLYFPFNLLSNIIFFPFQSLLRSLSIRYPLNSVFVIIQLGEYE